MNRSNNLDMMLNEWFSYKDNLAQSYGTLLRLFYIENGKLHFSWHLLPNVRNVHGLHNGVNLVDPFFVSHTWCSPERILFLNCHLGNNEENWLFRLISEN